MRRFLKNKLLIQTIFVFLIAISLFLPFQKSVYSYELPKPLTQEERDRIKREGEERRRKYEGSTTATPKPSPTATPMPSPTPSPEPKLEINKVSTISADFEDKMTDNIDNNNHQIKEKIKQTFLFIFKLTNIGKVIMFFVE